MALRATLDCDLPRFIRAPIGWMAGSGLSRVCSPSLAWAAGHEPAWDPANSPNSRRAVALGSISVGMPERAAGRKASRGPSALSSIMLAAVC
jgi:hypothetical protein